MNIRSANGIVHFTTTDGKEKMFRLDFNAVADLEALLGMGIGNIINERNIGFNIIRGFYWAGLKWRDKGMTVQRAGQFIQREIDGGLDFEQLMEPVTEALIASGIIDRADTEDAQDEYDDFDDYDEDGESKN